METVERLRSRIASAEALLGVVRMMKGLSAVYVRQYREAEAALVAYGLTARRAMQALCLRHPEVLRAPVAEPADGPVAAVLFGSEHGLCGRFDEALFDHALEALERMGIASDQRLWFPVGGRMARAVADRSVGEVAPALALPESLETLADRAHDALVTLEASRVDHGLSRILLFHHRTPERGRRLEPRMLRMFPLDVEALRPQAREPWPSRVVPTFAVDPEELLRAIVSEHVFMALHQAFTESLAAENAARLELMQAGERNVEDRLAQLRGDFHRRRQESITGELLDLFAAFESLRKR